MTRDITHTQIQNPPCDSSTRPGTSASTQTGKTVDTSHLSTVHLSQLVKMSSERLDLKENNTAEIITTLPDENPTDQLKNIDLAKQDLLRHLVKSKAIFKSQQKGDPDLSDEEKITIADSLLSKSHCLFLAKFGQFLRPEDMRYFDQSKDNDYQVKHYLNSLQRYFNKSTRQKDVRNRRYQALKALIEKGEYFSETEMMKRNPLLYEQLVGQYMTEKQKLARDNVDTKNITFLNLLMETMDRDSLRKKRKLQEEEEDAVLEENDSSDQDEDDKEYQSQQALHRKAMRQHWGEAIECQEAPAARTESVTTHISKREKELLKKEFLTNMYESFLQGNEADFDYSTVDDNEMYDNIDIRTQDEEEKYFDSESPETAEIEDNEKHLSVNNEIGNESEDELEIYMKSLKDQVAKKIVSSDNET